MHTAFSELSSLTRTIERSSISGQVTSALGLVLTVSGLERAVGIGAHCLVQGREGPVLAEVVGIDSQGTRLLPFGSWDGVRTGDPVQVSHSAAEIRPDDAWIGRVVNALGQPARRQGPPARG